MKQTLRLIGVLTLICVAAGLLLAWVHDLTREPIEKAEALRRREAIRQVLPDGPGEIRTIEWADTENGPTHAYHVRLDDRGRWLALATETQSPAGYGGPILLMMGVVRESADAAARLSGHYILGHAETPGLGAKIRDEAFRDQLAGRDLSGTRWKVRQEGGDIQAITAATISSQAVLEALRSGIARVQRLPDTLWPPPSPETNPTSNPVAP